MRFSVNPEKAAEALAFVAREAPGLSQKYLAKIFFYAEKWHLNRFGRPVVADTYIAMPQGPVPSTIRDLVLAKWDWTDKPENYDALIEIREDNGLKKAFSKGDAPLNRLSKTDMSCLREAIAFCKPMSADELSNVSHQERSWYEAERNRPMDFEKFFDPDNHEMIEIARAEAIAGVV